MKQICTVFFIWLFFTACNSQEKKATEENVQTAAREQSLKDSIAKFPESVLLKETLIQFYRDSAEFDKAIATVDQALQTDSSNEKLWYIKATLHFENEDTINSIRSFENVLRLDPSPKYLIFLGTLYAQTKNPKALDVADALVRSKLPETEKEAFFIKGMYFNYAGDKVNAIAALDRSLNLDNRYMDAYREKGIALYDMGKYDDAITVLDKAVTLQNSFDEGYYWLGRCLEKLNKPNDAIEEYKMALLYSNNDYPEAKEALARLGVK